MVARRARRRLWHAEKFAAQPAFSLLQSIWDIHRADICKLDGGAYSGLFELNLAFLVFPRPGLVFDCKIKFNVHKHLGL